jgi:hypothetical protein
LKSTPIFKSIFSELDILEYIKLSKEEYKSAETLNKKHIKWKHCDSPFGSSIYFKLLNNRKIVGRSMIQPRDILINNVTFKSGCVTDLLIHPKHRSPPSNFIELTKACNPQEDFDIIFHTSNNKSDGFYKNLFKYHQPFKLSSYVFPTKVSGILLKLIKIRVEVFDILLTPIYLLFGLFTNLLKSLTKLDIHEAMPSNEDLNKLLYKIESPIIVRTSESLKWRFTESPLWKAKIYCINKEKRFLGYFSTRIVTISGLRFLVVIDYLIDKEMSFLDCLYVRLWLIKNSMKLNSDFVFFMINKYSPIAKLANSFPMICLSDRFLPHSTPIFTRFKNLENKKNELFKKMHLTLADMDYF